jgi:hypothetical protein
MDYLERCIVEAALDTEWARACKMWQEDKLELFHDAWEDLWFSVPIANHFDALSVICMGGEL